MHNPLPTEYNDQKTLPSNDDPIISNNVYNTPTADNFSTPIVPRINLLIKTIKIIIL